MTLQTIRVIVASGFACWGAIDLTRRAYTWAERDRRDTRSVTEERRRRRALNDVTKGER